MEDAALGRLVEAVNAVVQGKPSVVEHALTAVLARGHVLLEDVPGVGKTTLAHAIARALGCSFRRVQFTSDMLPSDIIGVTVYSQRNEAFEFRPGPIFANLLLADEINRTTPKTQSSLLEAMNERQVSVDDATRPLPDPFIVVATQNPQDFYGTYPLPESQLDRFMVRLRLGYAEPAIEREILRRRGAREPVDALEPVLDVESLRALQVRVDEVRVEDVVLDYLLQIVHETRHHPQLDLGVSTRGALALQRAVQARALIRGRAFARPDDVKALAVPTLAHRVRLGAVTEGLHPSDDEAEQIIAQIVDGIPIPM